MPPGGDPLHNGYENPWSRKRVALEDGVAYPGSSSQRSSETPSAADGAWPAERVIHRGVRRPLPRHLARLVVLIDRSAAPFWNHPVLFGLLVVLAVWAGIWGFTTFYGDQFARTPWYTWPFVPDSPLSTTAWLIAAVAVKLGWDRRGDRTGKAWAFFSNWAAMMNILVGLWTVFVLLYHRAHFFSAGGVADVFQGMLVVAHLGMVGLAVLLLRKQQALPILGYLGLLALAFLWVFMDYFFVDLFLPGSGIEIFPNGVPGHPETLRVVASVTIGLALFATAAVTMTMRYRGPPSER